MILWFVALAAGGWLADLTNLSTASDPRAGLSIARALLVLFGFTTILYYDVDGVVDDIESGRLIDLLMTPVSRGQYLISKVAGISILASFTYLLAVIGVAARMLIALRPLHEVGQTFALLLMVTPVFWTIAVFLCAASLRFRLRHRALLVILYVMGVQFLGPSVARRYSSWFLSEVLDFLSPGSFISFSDALGRGSVNMYMLGRGISLFAVTLGIALYFLNKKELQPTKT